MLSNQMQQEALMMLIAFAMYLRPGEVVGLRVSDLVPPIANAGRSAAHWSLVLHPLEEGRPSKTQEFDETLQFDLDYIKFVASAIYRIMGLHRRPSTEKIFSRSIAQLRSSMSVAAKACSLMSLGDPHPYRLRHGGASRDYITGMRSLPDIQQRGRWKAQASVRRYQKGGRLSQLLNGLPKQVLADVMLAEQRLVKAVSILPSIRN